MNKLTVVSYNIWFSDIMAIERVHSLIYMINKINADVICLQEVKPNIYKQLIKLLSFYPFHFPNKLEKSYGCVIFSKYKIIKCLDKEYSNSKMGRSLLVTQINYPYNEGMSDEHGFINPIKIVIANTHYESLFKNEENATKLEQFTISRKILNKLFDEYNNVILFSDTNSMETEDNKFNAEFNGWYDSWTLKGTDDNKYTYDTEKNVYLKERNYKKSYKSRIDRILFKSYNLSLTKFDNIKACDDYIEPSDHFGIYSEFNVQIQK